MKNVYLILLLVLTSLTGFAQQTGDFIYVYQKDGHVQAFLREEIQEMSYSYEDNLGVTHDEIVSQLIALEDSVCRFPLNQIDSISFVTPPTVYKPGVTRIEEQLMPYVESCDSLTIQFAANTPAGLLPKVGDKLVTVEMNDKFEAGFAGVVASVSGTTVECNAISLGELFESYCDVTVAVSQTGDASRGRKRAQWEKTFQFPTFTLSLGNEITKNISLTPLAFKVGTELKGSITPKAHVKTTLLVDKQRGTVFNASADLTVNFQESLSLYGGLEKSSQFGIPVFKKPVCAFVMFYFKPGVFMEKGVEASFTDVWEQQYGTTASFSFCEKASKQYDYHVTNHQPTSSHDIIGCIDGRLATGMFTEVGFAPSIPFGSSIANLSLRSEVGGEIVGHAVLYDNDIKNSTQETSAYNKLKASNIQINSFLKHEIQQKVLGETHTIPLGGLSKELGHWDLVPKFTSLSVTRKDNVAEVILNVEKSQYDLVTPVDFGVALYNSKNEILSKSYLGNYWKGSDGGTFTNFFTDLDREEDYTISPIVKIMGFELRSSETAEANHKDLSELKFVDLGLSVQWASTNLGAKSAEEYGDYYAWGEPYTKPSTDYTIEHWEFAYEKDKYSPWEYTFIGWEISGTQYDPAASVGARLPTKVEWDELKEKCNIETITYKDVEGLLVTGPNGNSIFLPYAGCRHDNYSGKSVPWNTGSEACYWSGTAEPTPRGDFKGSAYSFRWGVSSCGVGDQSCYDGLSIRAVK